MPEKSTEILINRILRTKYGFFRERFDYKLNFRLASTTSIQLQIFEEIENFCRTAPKSTLDLGYLRNNLSTKALLFFATAIIGCDTLDAQKTINFIAGKTVIKQTNLRRIRTPRSCFDDSFPTDLFHCVDSFVRSEKKEDQNITLFDPDFAPTIAFLEHSTSPLYLSQILEENSEISSQRVVVDCKKKFQKLASMKSIQVV
jgi:hypothetical protein